ncbi:MAG: outer membrane protein assembly factor BamA [Gammaproteobacteria bacterium]
MLACLVALTARAEDFVVRDMRVEGLQRISDGTVFNYLPINIGDTLTPQRVREAIRALYAQGLFEDIAFRRDGDTLVIEVEERPSIAEFTIEGNKDIKTEDLQQSLRSVGLARGKTFDRSVLEEVTRFLTEQYYSRGKYGVSVVADVSERPNNQVAIAINVKEGERARIRQINIVGNEEFSDKEVRDQFELQTPNWLSFIRQDDRYARESLSGDLETLRSFYMDRGFADFAVESTQVAISPDKKDIYITINVREGERYEISDIKLAGEMVVPRAELERLILAKPGETFNLRRLTQTSELISFRLGADGYAQAEVEPVPTLDRENKQADVTIYVEPNNRVYVRRINFNGIDTVADEVLRREMRQMEGGYLSNTLVDRSKVRLQRLPYIEDVQVDTTPVAGSPDLVDVNYDIKYGLPGQFGGGIGYSESQKLILNGNFVHSNFLGTGNRVAAEINSGRYSTAYSISHTDPYRTIDGVRRTLSLGYRDITQFTSSASDFSTETITAGIDYGYPITEYQTLSFGLAAQDAELVASTFSTQQAQDWVLNNGNPTIEDIGGGNELYVTDFLTFELVAGWSYDSRNRAIFADRGTRQRFVASATIPGSEVEYYTLRYDLKKYFPITSEWIVSLSTELAFGEGINSTTALPPYKQFFAGGPGSVRGFAESDLGPIDSFGNPYGGNLLVTSQLELIIPVPESLRGRTRFSLFYDIGNVFNTGEVAFTDRLGDPITYEFDSSELKQSVGISSSSLSAMHFERV